MSDTLFQRVRDYIDEEVARAFGIGCRCPACLARDHRESVREMTPREHEFISERVRGRGWWILSRYLTWPLYLQNRDGQVERFYDIREVCLWLDARDRQASWTDTANADPMADLERVAEEMGRETGVRRETQQDRAIGNKLNPERRSRELLLSLLNDSQKKGFLNYGRVFDIKGSLGGWYTITGQRSYNVIDQNSRRQFCLTTTSPVPIYDQMAVQMLLLETDEGLFLKRANQRPLLGDQNGLLGTIRWPERESYVATTTRNTSWDSAQAHPVSSYTDSGFEFTVTLTWSGSSSG